MKNKLAFIPTGCYFTVTQHYLRYIYNCRVGIRSIVMGQKGVSMFRLQKDNVTITFVYEDDKFQLVSNRLGAFQFINPNFGGYRLVVSKETGNRFWKEFQSEGWVVVEATKTRQSEKAEKAEKAETKFVWCKASQQHWAQHKAELLRPWLAEHQNLKGEAYSKARKAFDLELKAEMKAWEASTAEEWNRTLRQQWAEEGDGQH